MSKFARLVFLLILTMMKFHSDILHLILRSTMICWTTIGSLHLLRRFKNFWNYK